jgi:hypothetical protein
MWMTEIKEEDVVYGSVRKPLSIYMPEEQERMRAKLRTMRFKFGGRALHALTGIELGELHRATFPRWFDRYRHTQAA